MALYQQWQNNIDQKNNGGNDGFFQNYLALETEAYKAILSEKKTNLKGVLSELAKEYNMDEIVFTGFLDGINTSLVNSIDLEKLASDTEVNIDIDYEKLYYNMIGAKVSWLYGLSEWEDIFDATKRSQIKKQYGIDNQAVSEKVGRNDPCPCGSGKKYKKCCG